MVVPLVVFQMVVPLVVFQMVVVPLVVYHMVVSSVEVQNVYNDELLIFVEVDKVGKFFGSILVPYPYPYRVFSPCPSYA